MRIKYGHGIVEECAEFHHESCIAGEWHVYIMAYGPDYYLFYNDDEKHEFFDGIIGEMSHEKFKTREEAEQAAERMSDMIFETGRLDLSNALEDWGLKLY